MAAYGRGEIASDHWQTMSNSTIPNQKRKLFQGNRARRTNDTSDIVGARTNNGAYKYTNKPHFHGTSDIAGAQPKTYMKKTNKVSHVTDCSDIPGAQPSHHGFQSNRNSDPLNPTYNLPKVEYVPPTPPKFLGDRMSNDDVEGAKPAKLYKWKQRNSMDLSDIEGSKPRTFKPRRGPPRNYMDVSDITGEQRVSKRVTDPLNPVHVIYGQVISDDPRSKPRGLPKRRNGPNLMQTTDIPGASSGWKPERLRNRRQVRSTNRTDDIRGAQADSRTMGIRTKRISNPLDPSYAGLDGTNLGTVGRPNTPPAMYSTFFKSMDADGDGHISAAEFTAALDNDGDGRVSKEEMFNAMQAAANARGNTRASRVRDSRDDEIERLKAQIASLRTYSQKTGPPP